MATITPPTPQRLAASQQKVRDPLQRLRQYIRLYVSLEGAAVLVLYLALWFWIGLAVDYGFFKAFSIDWAQEELPYKFTLGPWQLPVFRTALLLALTAGLLAVVASRVLFRLLRDFSDGTLALLLERRFPHLLGDRLITAVELADVRKAARYGYSPAMIEQTIVDAADRVDQAPVQEVFNWRRLVARGVVVGLLLVGVYLVVGGGACLWDLFAEHRASLAGFGRLHEVSGTWVERNILLRDALWPRRAFLELVGFPESGELRIGQEAPPPTLRARALKWIVHDPKAPETWRALHWQDLKDHPEFLDGAAPPALPEAWLAQRGDWTVDQVELQLGKQEADKLAAVSDTLKQLDRLADAPDSQVRKNPPAAAGQHAEARWVYRGGAAGGPWRPLTWNDLASLTGKAPDLPSGWAPAGGNPTVDDVEDRLNASGWEELAKLKSDLLDRLDQVTASRRYRDRVRKVIVPDTVFAISRGASSYNTITMQKTGDNEYAGTFTDLKENVRFTVRGEDYYTPYRRITVVPPPTLKSLVHEDHEPAYIYYRVPADSTANDLRTRKQVFHNRVSSLAGGDTTRIAVPFGTDIILTAEADKALRRRDDAAGVGDGVRILPPRKGVAEVKARVEMLDDHTFRTRFGNVREKLDFVFEFTDTDGVVGLRHVIVTARPDTPPDVDANVEVIRKTNQGYLITPFALVPFSGKVRDDHGLNEVNYVCTLAQVENQGQAGGKALLLLDALSGLGGGLGPDLMTAARLAVLSRLKEAAAEPNEPEVLPVPAFVDALAARAPREVIPQQDLLRFLDLSGDKEYDEPNPQDPGKSVRRQHPIMARSLFSEFALDPDKPEYGFDLLKLTRGPKIAGEREIQPRYRMQVWVEGVDNDLLTGPHRTQSKEKFTFQVVSANELLSEIAKEEEGLHLKLDDMVSRLREGRTKLEQVVGDLGAANPKPEAFAPMSVRSEEIEQVRDKTETATSEVLRDYQRILKEMDLNRIQRVQPALITRVERTITTPLDDILRADFPRAKEGLDELRKVLDTKDADTAAKAANARKAAVEAQARLDILIQDLSAVLNSMEGLTNINTLIKKLRDLDEAERAQYDVLDQLKTQLEKEVLKDLGLFEEGKPKDKKPDKK
jgi:hypothetical protein